MSIDQLGEFGLIQEIKKGIKVPHGILGIGDDCAVIPQTSGKESLISTDMLIDGTHFLLEDVSPYKLGWKSAAVNISDIAAMGGECIGSFLSFALPKGLHKKWIDEFIRGYKELSDIFSCPLLGGDTTSSPDRMCISVTVLGQASAGKSVKRSGTQDGDMICVTGPLGDSAAGLKIILSGCGRDEIAEYLINRHYLPFPRIKEGILIAEAGAHSMIDISDGVGSDLRHILVESGVGAEIDINKIPISDRLNQKCILQGWDAIELAICGGEDYELLFTIREEDERLLQVEHYVIGRVIEGNGIVWKGSDVDYIGYKHF